MAGEKILIVDDDKNICELLRLYLEKEGYAVTQAYDGEAAFEAFEREKPNLVLLDVMMPRMDGWEVCRKIRERGSTPVIMLTAKGETFDKVLGLELGADDYVTKPFRIRELITRIKTVLRRTGRSAAADMLTIDNISINVSQAKVYKNKSEIFLTALEYRLLLTLAGHRGQVLSRNQLLEGIWDVSGDFVNDNTLTVYMKRLREKLEDNPARPKLIKTVRGLGYMME